jgi:hypothetical protein
MLFSLLLSLFHSLYPSLYICSSPQSLNTSKGGLDRYLLWLIFFFFYASFKLSYLGPRLSNDVVLILFCISCTIKIIINNKLFNGWVCRQTYSKRLKNTLWLLKACVCVAALEEKWHNSFLLLGIILFFPNPS